MQCDKKITDFSLADLGLNPDSLIMNCVTLSKFLNLNFLFCKIRIIKLHKDMMRVKENNEYRMLVQCRIHSRHSVNEILLFIECLLPPVLFMCCLI